MCSWYLNGRPVPGFSATDCGEIYGDESARAVAWTGGSTLASDRPFRLRFVLRDADVYAFELK